LLAAHFGSMEELEKAASQSPEKAGEALEEVTEVGPKVAQAIVEFFSVEKNRDLVRDLTSLGLTMTAEKRVTTSTLEGLTFVLTGTLPNLPFIGNVDYVLYVNGGGTAVTEKTANFGTYSWQASSDGYIMRWNANGTDLTLTPNSDGQTALVTANNPGFLGMGAFSLSTVFRRTSTSITQTSAPVVTNTSGPAPVAKPVPDRPGFVYNPFDPNSKILLDVRGKASGTKLIEPKSGRLFIVP